MGSAKNAYLIVLCKDCWPWPSWSVLRNTLTGNRKTRNKSTHSYRKVNKTELTHLRLSSAYIVVTVWQIYPPFFTTFSSQKGDDCKYFGNFKIIFIDGLNQRKLLSMSKIVGILIYWSSKITSMKLQRGTYQTVVTAIYWCKNEKVNFYPSIIFIF